MRLREWHWRHDASAGSSVNLCDFSDFFSRDLQNQLLTCILEVIFCRAGNFSRVSEIKTANTDFSANSKIKDQNTSSCFNTPVSKNEAWCYLWSRAPGGAEQAQRASCTIDYISSRYARARAIREYAKKDEKRRRNEL